MKNRDEQIKFVLDKLWDAQHDLFEILEVGVLLEEKEMKNLVETAAESVFKVYQGFGRKYI